LCRSPGEGEGEEVSPKLNWLSIGVQQDLLLLPGKGDAVCAGGSGYTCFDTSNNYYSAIPTQGAGDDSVSGGLSLATTRVLIGYDRLFAENFRVGVSLGYAFGGGLQRPGGAAFLPVHAEARGQYWFGKNPFGHKGFKFFVGLAGGMAEVDSSLQTYAYTYPDMAPAADTPYNAWKKTGQGFVSAGVGTMWAITPTMGPVLELKVVELLPTAGTSVSPQLGYAIGF
jgi:hypothetical protein